MINVQETQLDYRQARFYNSETGRFLSVDPLGERSINRSTYEYAYSSPTRFSDPTGLSPDICQLVCWMKNLISIENFQTTLNISMNLEMMLLRIIRLLENQEHG